MLEQMSDEIYGDRADSSLVDSIKKHGILNPILVTRQGYIISGHRRWAAAQACGLDIVPVVYFESGDELAAQEALIESNRQRAKTNEQIGREYDHLKRIYAEQESRQGQRIDLEVEQDKVDTSVLIETESKPPTDRAAEKIGVAKSTANKASKVVYVIDELKKAGKKPEAEAVRA